MYLSADMVGLHPSSHAHKVEVGWGVHLSSCACIGAAPECMHGGSTQVHTHTWGRGRGGGGCTQACVQAWGCTRVYAWSGENPSACEEVGRGGSTPLLQGLQAEGVHGLASVHCGPAEDSFPTICPSHGPTHTPQQHKVGGEGSAQILGFR